MTGREKKSGRINTNDAAVYADEKNIRLHPLYRLGDFYEMFFDDALTASKELEITLTGKTVGSKNVHRCVVCHIMQ